MKCTNKSYDTYEIASRVFWALGQQGRRINITKLQVVACKTCHKWHIKRKGETNGIRYTTTRSANISGSD